MRVARNTMLTGIALALPYLAVWLFLPGRYGGKLVWSGLIVLGAMAAVAAWQWSRGRRSDREQDEREEAITSASARFAFFVMAVVVTAFYAWRFSIVGPDEPSFWLVVALWGSFAFAYIYNRVRM